MLSKATAKKVDEHHTSTENNWSLKTRCSLCTSLSGQKYLIHRTKELDSQIKCNKRYDTLIDAMYDALNLYQLKDDN